MNKDLNALTNPIDEKELEQILGGGDGVFRTISHECAMNTWMFIFTCCS
ncbi:lacticin 481 family lantibiotic [Bacillus safensis]|uniref:Butyrivibriocin n=1 Tax=Butyrivibrio fibrisolvens TaxID=831 RepID=Q99Q15_BUTFI|nr:butyrivibriocin [Butyrivibrio fibrisolvens]AAK32696.1 butyrivibriocin [Butyrivibrio fibrisolvens]AAK32698.1 butyrivibriocin [Butyrivibrio fibrisolvens]AAK32699.1 butyrivibriocin [Butyrivibrio fibrisolvens]AAK32701.1 butyrivibriocin [Butyrivibrio fibrisolvens]